MFQIKLRVYFVALAILFTSMAESNSLGPTAGEWRRLMGWLENNYREHLQLLNHPVDQNTLGQAENDLGYPLPKSLVEIMVVNNGEAASSDGLFGTWRLLSVSEQVSAYKFLRGDERFPDKKLHPFLESGGGDYYCIDLSSSKIVEWWHEGGYNGEISGSLTEFLKAFNIALIEGNYVQVEGFSGLVDKSDL